MEEKVIEKGVCSKPLKSTCRGLEEGHEEMILPYKYTPTLSGPRNQVGKKHHKIKKVWQFIFILFLLQEKES
jgi:hypothetical protein